MSPLRALLRDDRAVSATVTHALALGISAILISGLLLSAGTVLEDQRDNSAREQLRTVGNRIANDLSRAAVLAQDGGDVSIRSNHPNRIAGQTYTVSLLTGSACDTERFSTDACLELALEASRTRVMIPVENETAVSLDQASTGSFTVTAARNASAPSPTPATYTRDLRVGIGRDIDEFARGTAVNVTNRKPVSGFTFSPGQPSVDSTVRFRNDTKDLDGFITSYEWDFDGDGLPDRTGKVVDHNFEEPGKYPVTLTVTDDDGESDSVTKIVSVGGLVYEHDAVPRNVSMTMEDGAIHFNVTNGHSVPIEINEVLIDPVDDPGAGGPDELDAGANDEIIVEGDNEVGTHGGSRSLFPDGRIFDISGDHANLSAGDTARVQFNGFGQGAGPRMDMDGETVFVGLRYEAGGQFYTAQFTLDPGAPAPTVDQAPDPSFTVTCASAPTCSFTDTSVDPDGSIVATHWGYGDDVSVDDPPNPHDHDYQSNGSYTVGLTVTDDDGVSSTLVKEVQVGTPGPILLLAVNAGGGEETIDGITYAEDTQGDPHRFHVGDNQVDDTWDDDQYIDNTSSGAEMELYRTVRYGDDPVEDCSFSWWSGWTCTVEEPPGSFGYDVPVPDGQYEVTFKFAEIAPSVTEYEREIEVRLEGSAVLNQYDVYGRVGDANHALDVTRTVTVTDGTLNVEFNADSMENPPMVSAVRVTQVWAEAFQENGGGTVSMEAENHMRVVPGIDDGTHDMTDDSWTAVSDGQASGGTALVAGSNPPNNDAQESTSGERLDFYVDLDSTDTYDVWVRVKCPGVQSNAIDIGLDGSPVTHGGAGNGLDSNSSATCGTDETDWMWVSEAGPDDVTIDPDTTGKHTLNVWLREDGLQIDKVVLTKSDPADEVPGSSGDEGPPESPVN